MNSRWNEVHASEFAAKHGPARGEDLALLTYAAMLMGAEASLILHGGGNCSVKASVTTLSGKAMPALFVKPSGCDMAAMGPQDFTGLDLEHLRSLRTLGALSDEEMINEFMTHRLDHRAAAPSIETLVHAFIPSKFIDHTHPDAILALANQAGGADLVRKALGDGVLMLDYAKPGFQLALAAAEAYEAHPGVRAMVWTQHGLVVWGDTARAAYETTIDLVTRAETFLAAGATRSLTLCRQTPLAVAADRLAEIAPVVRGSLAAPTGDPDRPHARVIIQPLVTQEILDILDSREGKEIALSPPLTSDHLIRTKPLPMWVEDPAYGDPARLRGQIAEAVAQYGRDYEAYLDRHAARLPESPRRMDSLPRVVLMPGLGALCAGSDAETAAIARELTLHTLTTKALVARMGRYQGLPEAELFDMEYRGLQHAKLHDARCAPLGGCVALVTGAAGAIGSAVCEGLLENGGHVAASDLPGESLDGLAASLHARFPGRVEGVAMDVTDPDAVAAAFRRISCRWGGVDIVVANAGVALVASLVDMDLESFRRVERINTEGTLLVLAEAGRHFRRQATGGDIILVSTKNVFAPGAGFGAYSATKSAAHQLARIASLEFAAIDVRVNMVSPDAVFSHEGRRSGLWAEVGPDRMKARGLDAAGLEEYYRSRNLLKAKVTARHVARAVLFFATRQTPTTGATIPVDGGLPDSTPR